MREMNKTGLNTEDAIEQDLAETGNYILLVTTKITIQEATTSIAVHSMAVRSERGTKVQ